MSVRQVCDGCSQEFESGEEFFALTVEGDNYQVRDFHGRCRPLGELAAAHLDEGATKVTITRRKWY